MIRAIDRVMELAAPKASVAPVPATAGDDFDDAYPDLFRRAYRVAFRILGAGGEAEEVAQESLAAAMLRWKRIHSYREAWVARVAANKAVSIVRRRARAARTRERTEEVVDHDPDAALRLDLQVALLELPKRQREVITLRYLADQTEPEVARVLGCSVGTVKQHAFRALQTLRRRVRDLPEEL